MKRKHFSGCVAVGEESGKLMVEFRISLNLFLTCEILEIEIHSRCEHFRREMSKLTLDLVNYPNPLLKMMKMCAY